MMRKSRGKYWYKDTNTKDPFDKCICGRFKSKYATHCALCLGRKRDGRLIKKLDKDKKARINGYVFIYHPRHHRAHANGYVAEHILILEKKIGRKLRENELAHHINKIRHDNRPTNLQLMTNIEHNRFHNPRTRQNNPLLYGKYFNHKLDECACGLLKDVRSQRCVNCYNKERLQNKFHGIRKHKKDLCKCGLLKDARNKQCINCYRRKQNDTIINS